MPIDVMSALGKPKFRAEDEYGAIFVYEQFDERILTFDSIFEQSRILTNQPYSPTHEYIQVMLLSLVFAQPKHVTVLGLGGGGLVNCLHYYFAHMIFEAVELRQIVIDAAYQYFYLPNSERLNVNQGDAYDFLNAGLSGDTQLILSDLYNAHEMNGLQAEQRYIEVCCDALSADGWLVLNLHDAPKPGSTLVKHLKELFGQVHLCTTSTDNWILFCGKSARTTKRAILLDRCKQLELLMDKPFTRYFNRLARVGF